MKTLREQATEKSLNSPESLTRNSDLQTRDKHKGTRCTFPGDSGSAGFIQQKQSFPWHQNHSEGSSTRIKTVTHLGPGWQKKLQEDGQSTLEENYGVSQAKLSGYGKSEWNFSLTKLIFISGDTDSTPGQGEITCRRQRLMHEATDPQALRAHCST